MADGRRHSLDIPISKTLISLRRVRSLRDPSTTSTNKFSGLAYNVGEDAADSYGLPKSKNSCLPRREKTCGDDLTIESMKEKHLSSNNALEDMDSTNELIVTPYGTPCRNQVQPSHLVGDAGSQVSSPFQSTISGVSKQNSSPFLNEEVDAIDRNHNGCRVGFCWSQKFRESNLSTEIEGYPLLCTNVDETALNGRSQRCLKHVRKERPPYQVTPRNLCQKFRPTSFDDLVGQNAVSKSLLGAVLLARISSFYIFFGPRGTGKTSASRIFAAALNCLSLEKQRPCGLCQQCILFFSGRSRDMQEVDSFRINKTDRMRSLIKNAISPMSSRFKVFIIDECHMLREDTWATLLSSFDKFSPHSVFLLITPHLDGLPRGIILQSQRFYFPKIRDADIASRLGKICLEERLDFDLDTLDFISSKSNGSMRDAEMMLEQLSLLGSKITLPLAHELIGIVSDEELLELLHLALSSDTSNTVIRARELMRSRIDPMQLISQMADLIMDILAGKHEETSSEVRRKFIANHTTEGDVQKLSHALKILSEAEKQLRISKNQTTWLTIALLQVSSMEPFPTNLQEKKFCLRDPNDKDGEGDVCTRSSAGENLKHLVSSCVGASDECKGTLESIWKRAAELPQSNSMRKFLRKRGKLSALSINQGIAIAELEFSHPDHVARAEKLWKLIAHSLQAILGCNVEIRINLSECDSDVLKCPRIWRLSFGFLGCSRRNRTTQLITECFSDFDYYNSERLSKRETPLLTCSSCCGPLDCNKKLEVVRNLRSSDGNVLSMRTGGRDPWRETMNQAAFQERSIF